VSVKTQEGDTITIRFSSAQGNDEEAMQTVDKFNLAYEVEGDLSEDEHAALTKILSGIGELADDFFSSDQRPEYISPFTYANSTNNLNIDFLSDFDSQLLAGFDLSFSTSGDSSGNFNSNNLDLSYEFDQVAEAQKLALDYEVGMKQTTFTVDMSVFGQQDDQQLKNYVDSMEKSFEGSNKIEKKDDKSDSRIAMDERYQQHTSADFSMFKSAFSNMSSQANRYSQLETLAAQKFNNGRELVSNLTKQMITSDPRYVDSANKNNQLGAGISKLADFNAEFNSTVGIVAYSTNVNMSQSTSTVSSKGYQGVTQEKNLESSSVKKYGGERVERENKQNYTINTAIEGNRVVGLDQHHKASSEVKNYEYIIDDKKGLTLALTKHDIMQSSDESKIRLIEGLWLEKSSNMKNKASAEMLLDGYRPKGIKQQQHYAHQQLAKLIGDLSPYIDDQKAIDKLDGKLNSINEFMIKNKGLR